MLAIFLTLLTIAASGLVTLLLIARIQGTRYDLRPEILWHTRINRAMVPLGLGLALAVQTGPVLHMMAWHTGGLWSNPYVFHIPTAEDVWMRYVPSFLTGRSAMARHFPTAGVWTDIAAGAFVAIGVALLIRRPRDHRGRPLAPAPWRDLWPGALWTLLLAVVFWKIAMLLTVHIFGTLLFLTDNWFILAAVIAFLAFGAAQGGKAVVYNRKGQKIGEIDVSGGYAPHAFSLLA